MWLALVAVENPFEPAALVGVFGYVFMIIAFTLSFSAAFRAMPGFGRFHDGASHVVWAVFMLTLAGLASEGHVRGVVLGIVGLVALGVRVWGRRARSDATA